MARVILLGRLADLARVAQIDLSDAATLGQALEGLPEALQSEVARGKVRFALNGAVLAAGADPAGVPLGADDELALLPPVSGG